LDACLTTLHKTAASLGMHANSSSSSDALSMDVDTDAEQGYAALRAALKPQGDHWLLLRCGQWLADDKDNQERGLAGPALALLQVGANIACDEIAAVKSLSYFKAQHNRQWSATAAADVGDDVLFGHVVEAYQTAERIASRALLLLLLLLLLQVWATEGGAVDYTAWRLGRDGHPTGETFWSCSGAWCCFVLLELLTAR
jgi:hypothetical protein